MTKNNTMWVVEEWKDLDITARFKDTIWDEVAHGYEFELFEVVAWAGDKYTEPCYARKGSTGSGDFSKKGLEDAETFITGMIKWDGCSHFYFGDEGYLHLCGLKEVEKMRTILQKLVERARLKGVEED